MKLIAFSAEHLRLEASLRFGVRDAGGRLLRRATGLYPPGSFVELANGERGIAVARGRRTNLP